MTWGGRGIAQLGCIVFLGLVVWPATVWAQSPAADGPRPYEAPSFAASAMQPLSRVLPALPPEYLRHQQPGAHFAYHPSVREQVRRLIARVGPLRRELAERLGKDYLPQVVHVRLAVSEADMLRVVPKNSPPSNLLVIAKANLLVLRSHRGEGSAVAGVDTMFRRGLALMAIDKVVPEGQVPLWFRVGFASRFSGGLALEQSRALWWASMRHGLLPLPSLDGRLTGPWERKDLAQVQANALVAHLEETAQPGTFGRLIRLLNARSSFASSVQSAYQTSVVELDAQWRRSFARHRSFFPVLLASLTLWLLAVFAAFVRRRRRATRQTIEAAEELTVMPIPEEHEDSQEEELRQMIRQGSYVHVDADIPKVVHGGDWHTLH